MSSKRGRRGQTPGRGRGDGRKGPNTPNTTPGAPNTKSQICFQFQKGKCTFGPRCKFSHQASPGAGGLPATSHRGGLRDRGKRPERDPIEQKLQDLTRLTAGTATFAPSQAEHFLKLAKEILESDNSSIKQKLVQELADKGGLARLKYFVEAKYLDDTSGLRTMTFWNHCVPLLKIITDEELRSSLVLESAVGTIYAFIYGHSGARGVPFFSHVVSHLSKTTATSRASADFGTAVCAAAGAISMTLTFNQSAAVQKEFVDISKTLRGCLRSGSTEYAARLADTELSKVEQKLGIADLIPERRQPTRKPAATIGGLSYVMEVDFPGDLSANGARHDNDKASIRDIRILPTRGEIMSIMRNEYLPKKDYHPKAHHLPPGIVRILDTQFRLLREDTSGQLRDAIRYTMDALAKNPDKPVRPNGTQVVIYKNVVLEGFKVADRDGLQLDVSFDQPQRLTKSKPNAMARRKYWMEYKNLQNGALLCLIDQQNNQFSFMMVSERYPDPNDRSRGRDTKNANEKQQPVPLKPRDLADHPTRALVTLKLVDAASDLMTVVKQYHSQLRQTGGGNYVLPYLIEFPGMLFASFEPILRFLQNMILERTVPFSKLLAPEGNSVDNQPSADPAKPTQIEVSPPLYLTKGNIILDLSVILKDGYKHVPLTHSIRRPCSMAQLQAYTTLDGGQCEALIGGLSRELALIQGPPGTGKSYVGVQLCKILLHNDGKLKLGPIVCVCYTNHALDQFLVDLLEGGVERIVRLGSRSKEPKLEPYILRNVAQKVDSTWVERAEIRSLKQLLEYSIEEIQDLCSQLSMIHHWRTLKDYLQQRDPAICNQLFGTEIDEDGFEVVSHRKPEQVVDDWVHSRFLQTKAHAIFSRVRRLRTMEQILECRDISLLTSAERMRLKAYWESSITQELLGNLQRATSAWKRAQEDLKKMYQERDRRCLHGAQVIGVTTTGLAGQASLLRKVVAKVMVCEEAGEVLEAHTLTAILPSVEHAILIGDHQQLRPHIANYSLSMESRQGGDYALDESLFERLTREKYDLYDTSLQFPFATLDTQRRMHPSISDLIRQTLYPGLIDYPDTHNHPEVQGMARRLFWMNHDHMEAGADNSDGGSVSKSNDFEIDMVAALVKHLIKQGKYGKDDIAVLTPYLGQMQKMKKKLGTMFEILVGEKDQEELDRAEEGSDEDIRMDVKLPVKPQEVRKGTLLSELRLATVDNFQGEEAKVIVISLVRCNPGRRCGFLKTPNRINVLLSRAKHGMYIIGNADTSRPTEMWSNILSLLTRQDNFGDELELQCPRHKDKQIFVKNPDDFLRFSPEGGCDERCALIHECGHACTHKCHSVMLHKAVVCTAECTRKLPGCEHPCPIPCGKKCAPCRVPIPHVFLPCGHTSYDVACHEAQNPNKIVCRRSVIKTVPGCGHKLDVACFFDVTDPRFKCPSVCEQNLSCGHKCIAKCHECRTPSTLREDGSKHVQCRSLCERGFNTCGHSCTKKCHVGIECGVCDKPCELRCTHSKCTKKCSEACTPCAAQCTWNCVHRGKCNMPCAAPCDILPCSKRCEENLLCGHRCPSVCGEQCPDIKFCQQCAKPEILETVVDMVCMETYQQIELDTNPVIFLTCGHFFCMDTVDGLMQMRDVYEYDREDNIISQKPQENWIKDIKQSQTRCPSCRGTLTDILRYNRVAKGVMIEVLTQKFLLTAHREFLSLEQRLSDTEKELNNGRKSLEADVGKLYGPDPTQAAATAGSTNPITSVINRRHGRLMELSKAATRYITSVTREEQPYVRIHALVADCIRRKRITDSTYTVDDTSVVLRNRLLGQALFLRATWARLYDLLSIHELKALKDRPGEKKRVAKSMLKSIEKLKAGCKQMEQDAAAAHQPRQQVEAKLYHARFVSIELKFPAAPPPPPPTPEVPNDEAPLVPQIQNSETLVEALARIRADRGRRAREAQEYQEQLQNYHVQLRNYQEQLQNYEAIISDKREAELQSLREALTICRQYVGSTSGLKPQVKEAKNMVRGSVFFSPVTNAEMQAVYDAMRAELRGTGHWYYCVNRHPFTINNCGMPMELARCPQCDAPIGGNNHVAVAGVVRADDLEARFAGMHV